MEPSDTEAVVAPAGVLDAFLDVDCCVDTEGVDGVRDGMEAPLPGVMALVAPLGNNGPNAGDRVAKPAGGTAAGAACPADDGLASKGE